MNNVKNSVRLIGRVGQNPEVKDLSNGKKLTKFSLAVSERYKNQAGELITDTHWHNITVWGKQAELVGSLVKKGSELAIEGKLVTNNFTDKDGNKRFATEINLNEFMLLGSKKD